MYFEAALNLASLFLSRKETAVQAVRLCRTALQRDSFREELYQVLIGALIQTGQYAAAEFEYRQCTRMLKNEFGLEPSPEIKSLVEAIKSHRESAADLEPAAETENKGPFVCDHFTFRSVFRLETRRQRRNGETLTLVVIDLGPGTDGESAGEKALTGLTELLRQGDVICRWDRRRTVVQLPRTDKRAGRVVRRRLERALGERLARPVEVTCHHLEPSDQELALSDIIPEISRVL